MSMLVAREAPLTYNVCNRWSSNPHLLGLLPRPPGRGAVAQGAARAKQAQLPQLPRQYQGSILAALAGEACAVPPRCPSSAMYRLRFSWLVSSMSHPPKTSSMASQNLFHLESCFHIFVAHLLGYYYRHLTFTFMPRAPHYPLEAVEPLANSFWL